MHSSGRQRTGSRPGLQLAAGAVVVVIIAAIVLIIGQANTGRPAAGRARPHSSRPPGTGFPPRTVPGSPRSPAWTGDGEAVTLAFGGDVHFEGPLGARLSADPATALDGNIAKLLSGADLAMTNFESALVTGKCPDPQPKQYVFHAPGTALAALRAAGITLVTEANNHGEDCGRAGLDESLAMARAAHYPIIGIGADAARAFAPYRARINGQRIAIIAATAVLDSDLQVAWTATATQPGLASAYRERQLVAAVEAARKVSDTVVVYLHWGTETQQCPNQTQEPLARALVRAGADIVIGAHAHVQLGAGYLGTALVDYGLGNLAFYDTTPPETYSGSLLVTVTGRHIDSFRWRPALIESGLPVPRTGAAAAPAIRRWRSLRSCTDLSLTPTASMATRRSEKTPLAGPVIQPLADPPGR